MNSIYNLGILVYNVLARFLSPFNAKARLWVDGRKDWEARLKENINNDYRYIWIHCASLGEFEQGRPVIELIKSMNQGYRIVLTFFSPSGYEIRKNYGSADYVCYLPADTKRNAEKFVSVLKPSIVIFVKYEFWHNYITVLSGNKIPLYLISGIFRHDQHFFRWWGGFFRRMLFRFNHIFVQDEQSSDLLKGIGIKNVSVAGDTRFDRVVKIAEAAKDIPQIELFRGSEKLLLAGSSWWQDEQILTRYINNNPGKMKWVFAPHEIDKHNIDRLEKLLTVRVVRFSEFTEKSADARVMIIDNIGMLSSAYRYASIAAIGGGFGKGIHNILEAACWGIPVVFGPNHEKFREATDLIKLNGAASFRTYEEFSLLIDNWLTDYDYYNTSAKSAGDYVKQNTGATAKIVGSLIQRDMNSDR